MTARNRALLCGLCALCAHVAAVGVDRQPATERRYLYVALPGTDDHTDTDRSIRLLVFDIDSQHRFVRRIPLWPGAGDEVETVRGMAAHAATSRLYVSTTKRLAAIDLATDRIVWEKRYEDHCCERIAVSPDGATIYAPAFGSPKWYVIRAATGELRASIPIMGWPRATIYARDGRHAYLGAWDAANLSIADTATDGIVRTVGPFGGSMCPFTINSKATLVFANVDGLVGFEVGDLQTGLVLDRVAADGYDKEAAAAFECPSHGIAFTPDERELWVADGVQNRIAVFDAHVYPPASMAAMTLTAQPRWIGFGVDGRFAYVSTGEVIDARAKRRVAQLEDGAHTRMVSEHFVEIDFLDGRPIRAGF